MRHTAASCFPFESKRTSDAATHGRRRWRSLHLPWRSIPLPEDLSSQKAVGGAARAPARCGCAAPSPRCCQSSFSQLRKNLGRTGRGRKFWLLGERPAGQRFSDQPLAPDLARQGAEPRPNKIRGPLTQPNAPRISPWLTRAPGLGCRCSHGPVYSDNGDPAQ